jgi:hypothetical protein
LTLVRTDISEERVSSIIRVARISELGTTLTVNNNPDVEGDRFLRNVGSHGATRRHIPEDGILE